LKGHVAIDPDSEIITATTVSAGNAGDASVAEQLIGDLLENDEVAGDDAVREGQGEPGALGHERATVYGDAAYGTGELQSRLKDANIASKCKTQPRPSHMWQRMGCSQSTASLSTSAPTRSRARTT